MMVKSLRMKDGIASENVTKEIVSLWPALDYTILVIATHGLRNSCNGHTRNGPLDRNYATTANILTWNKEHGMANLIVVDDLD